VLGFGVSCRCSRVCVSCMVVFARCLFVSCPCPVVSPFGPAAGVCGFFICQGYMWDCPGLLSLCLLCFPFVWSAVCVSCRSMLVRLFVFCSVCPFLFYVGVRFVAWFVLSALRFFCCFVPGSDRCVLLCLFFPLSVRQEWSVVSCVCSLVLFVVCLVFS